MITIATPPVVTIKSSRRRTRPAVYVKNWLFVGHPAAGDRAAVLYSLIVSAQRRGLDPHAYLRDALTRLPTLTNRDDLTPLLPAHWKPAGHAVGLVSTKISPS